MLATNGAPGGLETTSRLRPGLIPRNGGGTAERDGEEPLGSLIAAYVPSWLKRLGRMRESEPLGMCP